MKKIAFLLFLIVCIASILIAGCTSTSSNAAASTNPATTPVQQPAASITTVPTTAMSVAAVNTSPVNITPIATTTASTTDPILHRWVRQYVNPNTGANGQMIGYEYTFYPSGSVVYNGGEATETSGNIVISNIVLNGVGTWSALGNDKYLVTLKYSWLAPTVQVSAYEVEFGVTGSNLDQTYTYTLVPAHEKPGYPGVTIPTHIESQQELDAITPGQVLSSDIMYFPEQAKID